MSLGGAVLFCQCTRYIFFKPVLASFCLGELFLNSIFWGYSRGLLRLKSGTERPSWMREETEDKKSKE